MNPTNRMRRRLVGLAAFLAFAAPWAAHSDEGGRTLFVTSAVERPDDTVTMPLHQGRAPDGQTVYYVVFDTSDGKDAAALGVNQASKLNTRAPPMRSPRSRSTPVARSSSPARSSSAWRCRSPRRPSCRRQRRPTRRAVTLATRR